MIDNSKFLREKELISNRTFKSLSESSSVGVVSGCETVRLGEKVRCESTDPVAPHEQDSDQDDQEEDPADQEEDQDDETTKTTAGKKPRKYGSKTIPMSKNQSRNRRKKIQKIIVSNILQMKLKELLDNETLSKAKSYFKEIHFTETGELYVEWAPTYQRPEILLDGAATLKAIDPRFVEFEEVEISKIINMIK